MFHENGCRSIKTCTFGFLCVCILMSVLLFGCGTFQRSGKSVTSDGFSGNGERNGAIHGDEGFLRIVERVGYYNGKLASPGLDSPDVEAVYRGRRNFWLELRDLTRRDGHGIPPEITDLLVREDEHLTRTLIELIGEGAGLYSPGYADSVEGADEYIRRLATLLDKKESSLYLLAWEIERLRGLLSQAGIDLEEDSYIESLTIDEIVYGLTWEELIRRLRESEHTSGGPSMLDLEEILYGEVVSPGHVHENDTVGDAAGGESDPGGSGGLFGVAGSGDAKSAQISSDSLSLHDETQVTIEDSLAAREEAIFAIVTGLMDDYEYRLAYDLMVSSFDNDVLPIFLEQMEIAATEDIALKRKKAADLYLEAKDISSARPFESLNLMRESIAGLDELLSRYPDHPRAALVRTNRESILKKLEELESRISIDAPR